MKKLRVAMWVELEKRPFKMRVKAVALYNAAINMIAWSEGRVLMPVE